MSDPNILKVDESVSKQLDAMTGDADKGLIRLSSGVVLRGKQANPNILIRAMTANPAPKVPVYHSKEMGRDIENPDDPDYISRKKAWEMEYSSAMLNVLIGLGTELESTPKGIEGPHPKRSGEMPNWIGEYASLGLPVIPSSPSWRYITWVMFIAAPTQEDTKKISETVMSLSGVKEADVRDAETFPAGN